MDNRLIYLLNFILMATGVLLTIRVIWSLLRQRRVRWRALIGFFVLMAGIAGYYAWESARSLTALAEARREYSLAANGPVRIAIPWKTEETTFFDGAKRAAAEINANPIKVIRPDGSQAEVALEIVPYPYDAGQSRVIAEKIAQDPSIMGVIGHSDVDGAIQASNIYDAAGLLYFAPTIRLAQLTEHNFPAVFRLSPSDAEVARAIAHFADENGLFNIVIVSPRNEYGYDLFQIYKGEISALNSSQNQVDAPHVRKFISYAPTLNRFDEIITSFVETATQERLRVDLVVILGTSAAEAQLLEQMRRRNLRAAVLCLPDLQDEASALIKATPDSAAGPVYVLSYGDPPPERNLVGLDEVASRELLAHDAVRLMVSAWQRTGSTDSREAAISLRAMPGWDLGGLPLDFLPNGATRDMPIRVEKLNPAMGGRPEVVFEMKATADPVTVPAPDPDTTASATDPATDTATEQATAPAATATQP